MDSWLIADGEKMELLPVMSTDPTADKHGHEREPLGGCGLVQIAYFLYPLLFSSVK